MLKAKRWAAGLLCCLMGFANLWLGTSGASEKPEAARMAAQRANVPEGYWIWVSIHEKSLILYKGVQVQKRYGIATGTYHTPSPIGVYRISHRFSGDLGGFGTRFLGLNVPWGVYGIHGTNRPSSIGSNASHGCIRMFVKDSEDLYAKVPNGAKVVLEGGPYGLLDTTLKPIGPGERSSHVAAVQSKLRSLGYYQGSADGLYGAGTARAVRKTRKALGLPDGESVDQAFYKAIGLILFE
ncbi:MAG: L,D-transpeptidase family protein [Clostridiales bacterium]|nr:L,D-transpeptidase family protein [Clostridiales bacterium]